MPVDPRVAAQLETIRNAVRAANPGSGAQVIHQSRPPIENICQILELDFFKSKAVLKLVSDITALRMLMDDTNPDAGLQQMIAAGRREALKAIDEFERSRS